MHDHHLHIVSFTIPYPPNYGGVIDVYHKIRQLHALGIKIHLHCFEYDRKPAEELEPLCFSIHYYPRKTGIESAFSQIPYIVISRRSGELIKNLTKDDYPVLFEGLHTCYYLSDPRLKKKFKIYRESNIEHHYYYNLYKAEKNLLRKIYFFLASLKLKHYEQVLSHADLMLAVSQKDAEYLQGNFPEITVRYLPSFHANEQLCSKPGRGEYMLYHGNLSVAENSVAAAFLIREVFDQLDMDLVIAGMNPPPHLKRIASRNKRIRLVENPGDRELDELIENAHVNILVTFQATGLKLKLLNALFSGRFTLVNHTMLNGTGLDSLCLIANTPDEIRHNLQSLWNEDFTEKEIMRRAKVLGKNYSNQLNAERLIEYIF